MARLDNRHVPHEIDLEAAEGAVEPVERVFGAEVHARLFGAAHGALTGPDDPEGVTPTEAELDELAPAAGEIEHLRSFARSLGAGPDLTVLTVDSYGAPSYGPLGKPEGIAFHTPENTDPTLAQAIATARWQAGSGNTSGGSYMGILGHNGQRPMSDPLGWTMVRSVPWNAAAGGLSTRRDDVWRPDRYPWLKSLLSAAAYADPNRYLQQIAISGRAAWWAAKLSTAAGRDEVRGALIALARWLKVLETAYSYDAVLTLHRHWQANRSDPAGLDFADLVLDEYAKLTPPEPRFSDVPFTHPHHAAIEWAAEMGISSGIGGGLFGPERAATRGELASFLHRALKAE